MDFPESQSDENWRIVGGDQQRTGYRQAENLRKDGCKELWRCKIPKAPQRQLVADDSNLYLRNNARPRTVIAIDKSSGAKAWEYTLSSDIELLVTTTPLSIDTTVVLREPRPSSGYSLLGLKQDNGMKQWQYTIKTDGVTNSPGPLVNRGAVVYDASADGTVTALNTESGETLWTTDLSTQTHVNATVVYDENLYIGNKNKEIHCIDCDTGEQRWSNNSSGRVRALSADNGLVIANCTRGDPNNEVAGYDAETGETVWTATVDGCPSLEMAVDDELVYIGTNAGTTHAIDLQGEEYWKFRSDEIGSPGWISKKMLPGYNLYGVTGAPTIAGDVVLFGSDDGNLYALDAKDGDLLWKHPVSVCDQPRGGIRCQPVVDDGVIYTVEFSGTKDEHKHGFVHAIDASSGKTTKVSTEEGSDTTIDDP